MFPADAHLHEWLHRQGQKYRFKNNRFAFSFLVCNPWDLKNPSILLKTRWNMGSFIQGFANAEISSFNSKQHFSYLRKVVDGRICLQVAVDTNRLILDRLKRQGIVTEEVKYDLENKDLQMMVFEGRHISNSSQISTIYTFMAFRHK